MSTKKIVAIIVLFLILAGLGAGLYLMRQQQDLREKAAPATTISIKKPAKTILVGESFDVTVEVDTSTNVLSGTELEINFDKEKLTLASFSPSTLLPVELAKAQINNTAGSATISLGAQPANPPQGKGTIATLKFEAKAAGNAAITFGPNTKAAGTSEATNVIIAKNPATISILAAGGAVSPSPAQVASASPALPLSPSPSASPVAGSSASPSPSTAPVGGSIASPSPSAAPSASASPAAKPTVTLPANKTVKAGDTITGTAKPNSNVTITIQSEPITATVKADATGKWSYAIPSTLSAGTHTLTITDSNGTYTTTFTVSGVQGGTTTPSGETPVAGFSLPTYLAIGAGFLLIIFGALLAF
ncbi:MAG: autotransporter-associated beta strand repeat-containing protein [Microgenomates group bacterium Gr01-1014_5]|nr:MAG: autotransporter-associated beta strand repeat-containing protein [Microgenomates group bacterium Gr01-1014_5]